MAKMTFKSFMKKHFIPYYTVNAVGGSAITYYICLCLVNFKSEFHKHPAKIACSEMLESKLNTLINSGCNKGGNTLFNFLHHHYPSINACSQEARIKLLNDIAEEKI